MLPPGSGGVRDYALALGTPLNAPLFELTRESDTSTLKGDWLVLHFSGYGFQKRGVPFWLPGKVRELRKQFKRVGIIFHELFATGPIWGSAFWLSRLQQGIARDLLREADFWFSNRDEGARWLLDQGKRDVPHAVLPVFSNVGEPEASVMDAPRAPQMVVFGSSGIRTNTYDWNHGEIFAHARRLNLELHDIGPPMPPGALRDRMEAEGVKMHGKLPAAEVSQRLGQSAYAALAYPTDHVAKSSIFAAYSAHGACTVLLSEDYSVHDGLRPNVHYASGFETLGSNFIDPRVVGRAAFKWYELHSLETHLKVIRKLAAGEGA